MSAPVEPLHYVTVTQDGTDGLPLTRVTFECRGDETSPCHLYPACDCESWGPSHEHPHVTHDECWMQSWFDGFSADDIAANYSPPSDDPDEGWYSARDLPALSGPIVTEYVYGLRWWWVAIHDHDHDPVHDGCRRCGALPLDGVPCEPPVQTVPYTKETDR